MVVLAHLQGVAATFRVGRHHHRGPLYEALGRTHALTDIAPTDLTVAAALVRKAYSKRRRSRLWSKPVNLRTCGLWTRVRLHCEVRPLVQAFAELRYGAVVHTRENSVKYGHNLGQTPFIADTLYIICVLGAAHAAAPAFFTAHKSLILNPQKAYANQTKVSQEPHAAAPPGAHRPPIPSRAVTAAQTAVPVERGY